jgi:hypothetical protein
MKVNVFVVLGLMLAAAGANLLTNGDFSTWTSPIQPDNWTVEDSTKALVDRSADPVRSPMYAVKITRLVEGTGNNKGLLQQVPVTASTEYTLSAWYLDNDVNAGCGLSITWRTAQDSFISNSGTVYGDSAIHTWQKVSKTGTAPANAAKADILLRIYGFSGSPSGGIVHLDDAEFVVGAGGVGDRPLARPASFGLQVNPNPVAGDARVSFELPRAGQVLVQIYDAAGSLRATPFSGALGAGGHDIAWNGADDAGVRLADGLYFLSLGTEGSSSVQKLVIGH